MQMPVSTTSLKKNTQSTYGTVAGNETKHSTDGAKGDALGKFEQTLASSIEMPLPDRMAARVRPAAFREAVLDYITEPNTERRNMAELWEIDLDVPRLAAVIAWEPVYRYRQEEQKSCVDVFDLWKQEEDILLQIHDWLWLLLKAVAPVEETNTAMQTANEDFREFARSATGKRGLVSMGVSGWHPDTLGLRRSVAEAVRAARWAHWFRPVGGVYNWQESQLEDALQGAALTQTEPEHIRALKILESRPDWSQTVRIYFSVNRDALRTGRILSVHQNTIDYRLACAADAMGFDPRDGREAALLRSAIAAYVLQS